MRKKKRQPWARRLEVNQANTGDMKGRRIFVKGTVNSIKRLLREAKISYKKVRHSGFNNIVEVVYTQQQRSDSPGVFFLYHKPNVITHVPINYFW